MEKQEVWVLYGKASMLLVGLSCFALGLALPVGWTGLPLRLWLWGFALLNILHVVRER